MNTRQLYVFQTANDVRKILELLAYKFEPTVLLSKERFEQAPSQISIDSIKANKAFLMCPQRFRKELEFVTLPDRSKYVESLGSPVMTVQPSRITNASITFGRYYITTTRVEGSATQQRLVKKDDSFLKWGEQVFRAVRARAIRKEAYPGDKHWFLPEAASLIDNGQGHWELQSVYVFDKPLSIDQN